MLRQALRFVLRLVYGLFVSLPMRYRGTIWYKVRTRGLRGLYRWVFVKLHARGERVGLQLLDPIEMCMPSLTPYPYMLEIEVTTRCHLRCTICEHTYWPDEAYKQQDLTYEQFKHIMRQFPGLRYINLTGEGSSFANPHFPSMLAYTRAHDIYTTVIDSFSAITPRQMEALVHNQVGKIVISLDGATRETYERVRVGARWARVLTNIRRFTSIRHAMSSPIPELWFRFIFFRDNYRDLPLYPRLINDLRTLNPDGYDNHVEMTSLLEFEQIRDWVYEPEQAIVDATNRELDRYGLPHAWSHSSHDPSKKRPMRECCAWAEPYILIGGYVLPCCSVLMSNDRTRLAEQAFGNVFEHSFRDIWFSPRYREFRRRVPCSTGPVPKLCVGCRGFDTTGRQQRYGIFTDT